MALSSDATALLVLIAFTSRFLFDFLRDYKVGLAGPSHFSLSTLHMVDIKDYSIEECVRKKADREMAEFGIED